MYTTTTSIKKCPFCAEDIQAEAIKCKHCGELLDPVMRTHKELIPQLQPQRKWSPGVAALLSFVIPGAGQIYKGDIGTGIAWFIFTCLGYVFLIMPGLILHLICILTAASGDPYK